MEEAMDIEVQVHDIMAGSELTAYQGVWPVSLGKYSVVAADLKDAWVLIVSFTILFNKYENVRSIKDYYSTIEDGFAQMFVGVPGLRTKFFTV